MFLNMSGKIHILHTYIRVYLCMSFIKEFISGDRRHQITLVHCFSCFQSFSFQTQPIKLEPFNTPFVTLNWNFYFFFHKTDPLNLQETGIYEFQQYTDFF